MSLLVVGTVAYDSILTPFGKAEKELGGSATYFSLSASFFAPTAVLAVVGDDFEPKHLKLLKDRQIDTQGIKHLPGKTFAWGGEYGFDLNQRTTLFTHLNVLEKFDAEVPAELKKTEFIFLGNIDPLLQLKTLNQLQSPKLVACDTMNYWIERNRNELGQVLKAVDILIINDSELRELAKESNVIKAARKILSEMGGSGKTIIVKRGEYGVFMVRGKDIFYLPAFPLEEVFDPTGAGDTFAGGFMGYLAQTKDLNFDSLKQACVAGSTLASFSVEKMGTERLQQLSKEEIKQRQKSFKELTHFDI